MIIIQDVRHMKEHTASIQLNCKSYLLAQDYINLFGLYINADERLITVPFDLSLYIGLYEH